MYRIQMVQMPMAIDFQTRATKYLQNYRIATEFCKSIALWQVKSGKILEPLS